MKNFFSVLSFFSLILIMSCSNENKNKKTNFNNYIAGHSSGIISANSQITIKLTKDIADLTAEELVDKKLLTFEPKIDGEIYWSDKRTLVFEPNESLNRGDTYLATFRLKSLIKESKKDLIFHLK
jgi:hypothetical protein